MKLIDYKFPEISQIEMDFSTIKTCSTLLKEAKDRGFYGGNTPYNKKFSELFFNGGNVEFKSGINPEYKNAAWNYCKAFMRSWEPRHEEKEAICAMLMSEIIEL